MIYESRVKKRIYVRFMILEAPRFKKINIIENLKDLDVMFDYFVLHKSIYS